jgi:hypothetical protein
MTDTATFTERSDLPTYAQLNGTHSGLIRKRNAATDEAERHRLNTLIANIEGLKRNPEDTALMKQFGKNVASFEKYLAERDNG